MRTAATLVVCAVALSCSAQDLASRHALINKAYEAEQYAEVVRLVDAQIGQAKGTAWADSLQFYQYPYARAVGKTKGVDAGIAAGERILALVKQRGNGLHTLSALFDLSWTYYEAGRVKECVRVDSTAVTVADGDPAIPARKRGQARQYLAFDYSVLGDHRNSAKYANAALAQYAMADSGDVKPVQWAESYTAAGVANWHLGHIRQAEAQYLKALDQLGNDTTDNGRMRQASAHGNLGVLWQSAGDLVRSKDHYHRSLRLFDKIIASTKDPSTRDEALVNRSRSYLNLATVYFDAGDDGRAQELLDLAWADRSKVLQPDDPQLFSVRERMGDLALDAGELDKARDMIGAYAAACERKFGKRGEEYVRACSKLGRIAALKGDDRRADSLFAVSIAAGRLNADPATDKDLVSTMKYRAEMRAKAGRNTEAMQDLLQGRKVEVNIHGAANFRVAQCDVLLAEQAFILHRHDEAKQYADSALGLLGGRVKALRSSPVPVVFQDPRLLADAIYWKLKAEQALHVPDSISAKWDALIDLAVLSLSRNRASMSDAASKLQFIASQQRLFSLALDMAYAEYARTHFERDLERFLGLSEANRSILLKDRLNAFGGLRFAGLPDSIIAQEQELLAALDLDGEEHSSVTDLDKREREYAGLLGLLAKNWPKYYALRYGERMPSLADIRTHLLDPGRQLLAYAETDGFLYAVVIGQQSAQIVRMDRQGLDQAVQALQSAIKDRETAAYLSSAHRLYQRIFAPLAGLLRSKELLIVSDGPLRTVNFETLLSAPGAKEFKKNLLIQRYAISYLFSATTALQFADLGKGRGQGTLAMAPGFADQVKKDYLAQVRDSANVDRRFLHFVRQPFAVLTAQSLGRSAPATVVTGSAASEETFRREASKYGILFLGTHAEMDPVAPMYSRLVLSKDGDGGQSEGDGYLHAYEIYEMDLKAQLAVIAACESGTGKSAPGEGVRSLGAGLAYAGCPSLVASLWSIDEKTSAQIITRFYEYLQDGMPKHLALRQAKLDHLASTEDELALPYYWAGLVLTGDVRPVVSGAHNGWWWATAAGVLLLATVLVIRFLSRRRSISS